MSRRRRSFLPLAFALAIAQAQAQEELPVPRATIYPGETIADEMLAERSYELPSAPEDFYARSRDALVGKVARRTLLPKQPIPTIAVDNPRIVRAGAQIKIVFSESGLDIVAYGIAQQAGGVGDLIRVRNQESGLFVSGRVQSDGSVRVGEG
jgi:flagellar basal body P-ring formation protein FlgA